MVRGALRMPVPRRSPEMVRRRGSRKPTATGSRRVRYCLQLEQGDPRPEAPDGREVGDNIAWFS